MVTTAFDQSLIPFALAAKNEMLEADGDNKEHTYFEDIAQDGEA